MKKALITGISGQDGSFMADYLLNKGYEVYGAIRRSSAPNYWRISHIIDKIKLVHCDITDCINISNIVREIQPDELYNFASMSQVGISFKEPINAAQSVGMNCLYFLEAIRHNSPHTKYFYASSSEQFGSKVEPDGFQRITTKMDVCSPYAAAKLFAFNMVDIYRKSYNLDVRCAICFNHESDRRGEDFVTRKITRYLGKTVKAVLRKEKIDNLSLGNTLSYRDWTHAKDCIEAFWLMMQSKPKDYVVSSMETHSVKEFLELAFFEAQKYLDKHNADYLLRIDKLVKTDPNLYRPNEVEFLKGDSTPIREELGWKPKYTFNQLVEEMVLSDIERELS